MLQDQLEERAKERIRIEEQQECERLMMLRETERLRQEELRQQVEKKLRAQQLVAEVWLCVFCTDMLHQLNYRQLTVHSYRVKSVRRL